MNKRQKNKMIKNKVTLFALKNELFKELKQDSVAHLIKDYFTMDNIRNKEMFKPENGKIMVSKKALNHILKICGCELLEQEFDFEFVDEIKVLPNNDKNNLNK